MKLILIDDESATRNGLLKHISWLNLGIDQIKTVANPIDALRICEKWKPEIVLSDVRMPEMDGITLCQNMKAVNPDCEIIFISGYADKEALIAAIGLGAVSFVEKPIDIAELELAIDKAVQKYQEKDKHVSNRKILAQNLPVIEMEIVSKLIEGRIDERLWDNLSIFDLHADYQVLLFRADKEFESRAALGSCVISGLSEMFAEQTYIKGYKGSREMICILFGMRGDRFGGNAGENVQIKRILGEMKQQGTALFCAVGKPVQGLHQVRDSYESARRSMKELFFKDYGNMAYVQNTFRIERKTFDRNLRTQCIRAIEGYDFEGASRRVHDIYKQFMETRALNEEEIREFFFEMYYTLYQLEKNGEGHPIYDMENIWREIMQKDTLIQLKDSFVRQLDSKMNHIDTEGEISNTVFLIMRKIHQEYSNENLNIMQLAESVYLTPSYLSSIFKKETHMTIGQYITQVRISSAKKHLKDNSLKLYQIAEKCGYNDPNYFAKIFRKNTGMTPSEYRGRRECQKD